MAEVTAKDIVCFVESNIKPELWFKGDYAKDKEGYHAGLRGAHESEYPKCTLGWLVYAYHTLTGEQVLSDWGENCPASLMAAQDAIRALVPDGVIYNYNDDPNTTFEDVKGLFAEACAALE